MIKRRIGNQVLGFNLSEEKIKERDLLDTDHILNFTEPEDLIKFGLIPEFIGRLPVVSSLQKLSEDDLVRILKEPKNALIKQYQKLMEMEGVALHFEEDAIRALAEKAVKKGTGARGLRSIIEELMLDIMYSVPSRNDVKECIITRETVLNGSPIVK